MSTDTLTPKHRARAITANRWVYRFCRIWLLIFSLVYGLYIGIPFLAPVFMQLGWDGGGKAIYFLYTFLCHQLPQRSLFLFGSKAMYTLPEIQAAWQETINPLVLRQFVGNPVMGWKVAWSDRMVSMYTSVLLFAWIWHPLRQKLKQIPWWGFVLLLVPMGIDGITHMISDLAGIGQGFRDSNAWLAALTNHAYPATFYAGDALGTFNSWMRWISGFLFGLGIVWFGFPYLDDFFMGTATTIKAIGDRKSVSTNGGSPPGKNNPKSLQNL
jgi:uncharacterized membrane protein